MKATMMQRVWIMIMSIYVTLNITLRVLYRVYFTGGYPRAWGDEKLLRWWAGKLLEFARIHYTASDPNHTTIEPGKRYIIMSNHRSLYDIPLIIMSLPGSIRMLTKKELFKVPLWGRGMEAGEFISIDRHNLEQAKIDLAKARAKMESGIVLWIAPEGTRSRTGRMGPFKKGGFIMAIESGATIIPVGIQGSQTVLPPKTWDFYLDQNIQINIGEQIEASRYTMEQKEQLLADVRSAIAGLCGEA
ncbi:MAG: lysophospholipid acyltransferase family protein [Syntrophaceae bacterium]